MGHLTVKNYKSLYRRMDQFVNGVFDSEELFQILTILFTDEEAQLCSLLPLLPASAEKISKIWELPLERTETIIETLIGKGLLYEDDFQGSTLYTLAIPIFGFFEFSLMRNDGKYDREALSHLYNKYITEDDQFVKKYFGRNPPISRTFVHEETLSEEIISEILPYEKATHIVEAAETISVGTCFCRHKMEHAGKACDNPQDVCLSFGSIAQSLIDKGIARQLTKNEALAIIKDCIDKGLVQIGDNIQDKPAVICNCCGCCCDLLLAYKRTGMTTVVTPSNYIARIETTSCTNCGICSEKCPVDAISELNGTTVVNSDWCLGCGVCVNFCPHGSCVMETRPIKQNVPKNTLNKVVLAAIYQGKVGNFLFDNQKSAFHAVMRRIVNSAMMLPPWKQLLLTQAVQNWILQFTFKKNNLDNFEI